MRLTAPLLEALDQNGFFRAWVKTVNADWKGRREAFLPPGISISEYTPPLNLNMLKLREKQ